MDLDPQLSQSLMVSAGCCLMGTIKANQLSTFEYERSLMGGMYKPMRGWNNVLAAHRLPCFDIDSRLTSSFL